MKWSWLKYLINFFQNLVFARRSLSFFNILIGNKKSSNNIGYKISLIIFLCSIILCSLILVSCIKAPFPGYSQAPNGLYYKIFKFGESNSKPIPTDYITVDIEYRTADKDSLFFSGRRKFQTTIPDYTGSVDECFSMMSVDDSASFIINAYKFFRITLHKKLPSFFNTKSNIKINVKLLNIQSSVKFLKEKEEFLSWTNDLGDYEKTLLKHFLQEKDSIIQPTKTGLYCIKTTETNGTPVKRGCVVTVHYEGQFLNGEYFDSTKKRNMPFDFMFGKELQVVKGLEEGIGMLNEGESAILIMPSQLAFGKNGSSSGIIPPFTTVIFKVEILSVDCSKNKKQEIPKKK